MQKDHNKNFDFLIGMCLDENPNKKMNHDG